jgi:hypothetical protein
MDSRQQRFAFALLLSGLGRQGQTKAMNIMALETILGEMEGGSGRHRRDPNLYFLTVFGEPSDRMPWGWRFEGHHISLIPRTTQTTSTRCGGTSMMNGVLIS